MMLSTIIIILGISFVLYAILGGADFGAGIVETFAGKKGEKTISKSIAPVWEANHVWLILAIVILFTGFPKIYSTISTSLHIPLMVVLIGIVLRGTSFTFRHYDDHHDPSHRYYSLFFKVSSFITPFFLGVTLGAMILGDIRSGTAINFYEGFIKPWLNPFCFMIGLFAVSLFGYIAAVFLIGEASYHVEQKRYVQKAKFFLIITVVISFFVFITAEWQGHHLLSEFFQSTSSIIALSIVIIIIPLICYLFDHPVIIYLRAAVGTQVALIMLGWFSIQFPVVVYAKDGNHLTFYNTQAPEATLTQLLIALIIGLILVVPAFYFLFKVFKRTEEV
jgi:cytochrome bd ubiquinol oxidase subunit II